MVRVNDIAQIPARDDAGHRQVFHYYLRDRRSQTRGVTAFAPMADTADHSIRMADFQADVIRGNPGSRMWKARDSGHGSS